MTTYAYGKGFAALRLDHIEQSTRHESLTGSAATLAASLRELPANYAAGVRVLSDRLREIDGDQTTTEAGKGPRRDKARDGWQRATAKIIQDAQKETDNARRWRESRVQPAPLHPDQGVAQARLANARSDARMLLDAVKPTDLRGQLEQLVSQDADSAVRYLLLTGNWFSMYATSRGSPGLGTEWENDRRAFMGPLLSADGKAALAELDGLSDVLSIPQDVSDLFTADARAHGLRLTEL